MTVNDGALVHKNETEHFLDVLYASVTAQEVTRFDVFVNDELIDSVWAGNGGSHSWWAQGGGKLLSPNKYPNGIPSGSTLKISPFSDRVRTSIRVDFYQ